MIIRIDSITMPTQVNAGDKFLLQVELHRSRPRVGLQPHKGLYPQPDVYRLFPEPGIHPRVEMHPRKGT